MKTLTLWNSRVKVFFREEAIYGVTVKTITSVIIPGNYRLGNILDVIGQRELAALVAQLEA